MFFVGFSVAFFLMVVVGALFTALDMSKAELKSAAKGLAWVFLVIGVGVVLTAVFILISIWSSNV